MLYVAMDARSDILDGERCELRGILYGGWDVAHDILYDGRGVSYDTLYGRRGVLYDIVCGGMGILYDILLNEHVCAI